MVGCTGDRGPTWAHPEDHPITGLPSAHKLVWATNFNWQKRRPKQPTNLDFDWVHVAISEVFLQHDVRHLLVARHIILFTTFMWDLLCRAKVLYIDVAFKTVQKPFSQLFFIHGWCICQSRWMHQKNNTLLCILSKPSIEDYTSVLTFVKEKIDSCMLTDIVLDFEVAT
jgi:hypothetical protein